jgi:hypothetical protein
MDGLRRHAVSPPGFSGNLNKGESATLTCNGQGFLRCNARIT